jgi:hypothetical protein
MKTTADIRNKEIKITVNNDEDSAAAITRYMTDKGFKVETWTDGKGLNHRYFYNKNYSELWISTTNFIDDNTLIFELNGNK